MFPSMNFPLRRLALMVATAYAPAAIAIQAGRIDFTTGEPVAVSSDGRERQLRRGEEIVVGDRISTRSGRAQVSFTDGSFVSLQPNTEFAIDEYNFKGKNDGSEKGVFSLFKGALRTITGIIGRGNRDAYSMRTPTATIGIRGTGGLIEANAKGTFVRGTSGTWFMTTKGGVIDIPAGLTGFAGVDDDKAPEITSIAPNTPPQTLSDTGLSNDFIAGNQQTALGMADGTGYRISYAMTTNPATLGNDSPTNATFSSGIALTSWNGTTNTLNTGSVVESGNDGWIGWGRWIGSVNVGGAQNFTNNQGVHYVVGIPTATMPTAGTGNYALLGATSPTWINGTGSGTLSASFVDTYVKVNFSSNTLDLSLKISMGTPTYTISQTGLAFTGNSFTNTTGNIPPLSISGSGGACLTACSGSVSGFFTGAAAERVGMTYRVSDPTVNNTLVGSAAFTR